MIDKATVKAILPNANQRKWGEVLFSKKCATSNDARRLYQFLKLSMLDVGNWNNHSRKLSIQCILTDQNGMRVGRIARDKDHIRIKLSGWDAAFFEDVDWFEIQRIEERLHGKMEFFFFTMASVREPSNDPEEKSTEFGSVFTFFIICEENKIDLLIHTLGQYGVANPKTWKNIGDILKSIALGRNFYKRQWGKLLKSLLDEGLTQLTNLN